jgi:acetylornithine/N-succinyldiaminopimelate aminotransferase
MRDGFEPLLPGFTVVPFNDLDAALAAIDDNTAGFLLEPVQGEGGVTPATQDFLKGLRQACDDQGLLLILDEVQCGYARTGTFFAHEQYGVTPDIMAVAKGIGAGFPLGACLATEEAAKGMVFGTHGSTYGGNPLAMAAGGAVLDEVLADGFLDEVKAKGARLRAALEQLIPNHDGMFEEVRGLGLMLGLKMKDGFDARSFVGHLRDHHGLLTVSAGQNVVRILPPLVIEESHIAECIEKISAGARSFAEPVAA